MASRLLPPVESLKDLETAEIPQPTPIIDGLLERGSKLMLVGTSKGHKTWTMLGMACCLALPTLTWFRFPLHKTRVLFINFEIQRYFFRERIRAIATAMGKEILAFENIDFWNLRGCSQNEGTLVKSFKERLQGKHQYGLAIIDPYYKLSGSGKVENSAEDVASVMRALDEVTVDLDIATAFSHHSPKGDVSERAVVDRGSGSGVFGRDPDAIVSILEIKGQPDNYLAEFALRNHPPVDPIGLHWNYPLMKPDDTVEKPKVGRKKVHDSQKMFFLLPMDGTPMRNSEWEKLCQEKLDIPHSSFNRYRKELVQDGEVENIGDNQFRRSFSVS